MCNLGYVLGSMGSSRFGGVGWYVGKIGVVDFVVAQVCLVEE